MFDALYDDQCETTERESNYIERDILVAVLDGNKVVQEPNCWI